MAIQHALAGLYPPFEATAPTVLGQVFRLLDSDFRGDGLSFLLDFLIPAKRLCEQVREAACVSWGGPGLWQGASLGGLRAGTEERRRWQGVSPHQELWWLWGEFPGTTAYQKGKATCQQREKAT